MVDTHDIRLPWLAFFTNKFVKAGQVAHLISTLWNKLYYMLNRILRNLDGIMRMPKLRKR